MHTLLRTTVAAALLAGSASLAQAQTVVRQQGSTTNYTSIESEVEGREMTGMRVSATFENGNGLSTAFGFWSNLAGSQSGVDLVYNGTTVGTVRLGDNTNTFDGNYTFNWLYGNDFRTLKFEGGTQYGNVIFDIETGNCGTPSITCAGQTTNSSTGNAFDIESGFDYNDFVRYSNVVTYAGQSIKFDAFTTVEMHFDESSFGPDDDQTPFTFQMDTDLGRVSTVPEPSTYALMAAGLAGLGLAARRRRNAA